MSKARDLANAGTALGAVSATELAYVDGVTSAIQTQIDSKIGSASAINPTIVDAKGDIIAASAADTPARLAVGNNGETLVADSSTSTGLRYQENFAAGKNAIINGDFGVWQRGTSFSNLNGAYAADRFRIDTGGTATTMTTTQQTFTPGTAPVSGYESKFFFRNTITTVGTMTTCEISQFIEDVRTDAGQTITISFWAKADSARTTTSFITQTFGSGGSSPVDVNPSGNTFSLTTSWQRFSFTLTMPSISGKTIGTNSYVRIQFRQAVAAGSVFDFWGLQVEQGSTATAFQTATGTLQGELAACQRYFEKSYSPDTALGTVDEVFSTWTSANAVDTTLVNGTAYFKVTKRIQPTITIYNTSSGTTGSFLATSTSYTVSSVSTGTLGIGRIYATTSMTANTYVRFHWTASAEL